MKEQQKSRQKPTEPDQDLIESALDGVVSARNPSARCPYCHEDVKPRDEKQACNGCMAWHHKECWQDYGRCVICGLQEEKPVSARQDLIQSLDAAEGAQAEEEAPVEMKTCGHCQLETPHSELLCVHCGSRDWFLGLSIFGFLILLSFFAALFAASQNFLFQAAGGLALFFSAALGLAWTVEFIFGIRLTEKTEEQDTKSGAIKIRDKAKGLDLK